MRGLTGKELIVLDFAAKPDDWPTLANETPGYDFDVEEGARRRGFTAEQCEYLASCIGLAWAKGHMAGEEARGG